MGSETFNSDKIYYNYFSDNPKIKYTYFLIRLISLSCQSLILTKS